MHTFYWGDWHRASVLGSERAARIRVSPMDALRSITTHAAYQYFEEDRKGSIAPGKLADLVILSANPLTIAPEALWDLAVVETIKEGTTVYARP